MNNMAKELKKPCPFCNSPTANLCCDYKQGHQIYGAIWTDKGLIYAMKMNERGNWELL